MPCYHSQFIFKPEIPDTGGCPGLMSASMKTEDAQFVVQEVWKVVERMTRYKCFPKYVCSICVLVGVVVTRKFPKIRAPWYVRTDFKNFVPICSNHSRHSPSMSNFVRTAHQAPKKIKLGFTNLASKKCNFADCTGSLAFKSLLLINYRGSGYTT